GRDHAGDGHRGGPLDDKDHRQRDGRDNGEAAGERRDENLAPLAAVAAVAGAPAVARPRARSARPLRLLLVVTGLPVPLLTVSLLPVLVLLGVPLQAGVARLTVGLLPVSLRHGLGAVPVGAVARRTVRLLPVALR